MNLKLVERSFRKWVDTVWSGATPIDWHDTELATSALSAWLQVGAIQTSPSPIRRDGVVWTPGSVALNVFRETDSTMYGIHTLTQTIFDGLNQRDIPVWDAGDLNEIGIIRCGEVATVLVPSSPGSQRNLEQMSLTCDVLVIEF